SALPAPALRRQGQSDLLRAAALPRLAPAAGPPAERRLPPFAEGLNCSKRLRRERRSIAPTTAARARARSAWFRADYSGRPVRGLPRSFAARPWRADSARCGPAGIT